jgi:hypothetical protein
VDTELEKLRHLEQWVRWWIELPDDAWSGHHMRGYRNTLEALRAISPTKQMTAEEVEPRAAKIPGWYGYKPERNNHEPN